VAGFADCEDERRLGGLVGGEDRQDEERKPGKEAEHGGGKGVGAGVGVGKAGRGRRARLGRAGGPEGKKCKGANAAVPRAKVQK
jgi:hypothetical protein